jgi:hypothetical protein
VTVYVSAVCLLVASVLCGPSLSTAQCRLGSCCLTHYRLLLISEFIPFPRSHVWLSFELIAGSQLVPCQTGQPMLAHHSFLERLATSCSFIHISQFVEPRQSSVVKSNLKWGQVKLRLPPPYWMVLGTRRKQPPTVPSEQPNVNCVYVRTYVRMYVPSICRTGRPQTAVSWRCMVILVLFLVSLQVERFFSKFKYFRQM